MMNIAFFLNVFTKILIQVVFFFFFHCKKNV